MKKFILTVIGAILLVVATLFMLVLYFGPRMAVQPHVRAFQKVLPPLPRGTRTVAPVLPVPTAAQAATLGNPLPRTPANLEAGRTYYRYYCVFCHGRYGDGNGPVGQSYVPTPTDLRSNWLRGYSDGVLLRAMLTGVGHEPVLERVVPPAHRWPLVLYLREFSRR